MAARRGPGYSLAILSDEQLEGAAEHAPPRGPALPEERHVPEPEGVKIHPAARLMPMMTEREAAELRESIRDRGFNPKKPLIFVGDELLDGRNRLWAALAEGLQLADLPREPFDGDNPYQFVWDENYGRRHLTEDQRIAIAVKAAPLLAEEARRRMAEGGRRGGLAKAGNADVPTPARDERARTAVKLAEQAQVSIGKSKAMLAVEKRDPFVAELVRNGRLEVAEARRLIDVPDEERPGKVAQIRAGADKATVIPPPKPRPQPNLGRQLGLYAVNCGCKLEPFRDLLVRLNEAYRQGKAEVRVGKTTLTLAEAGERLAELLPRPRSGKAEAGRQHRSPGPRGRS